jgi:hypothetical protein
MLRLKRTLGLLLALGTLILLSTSCGTDHSKVRFVHASPDVNSVDVAVDSKNVATDLPFQGVAPASGYLTVTAGSRKVEISTAGTTDDLINSNISFGSGKEYSVFATGFAVLPPGGLTAFSIAAVLLTDDNSGPSSGNVKIRVLHAAPVDAIAPPDLDVYIVPPDTTDLTGLTPNISSLSYGQASAYQDVPATSNRVIFTNAGSKSPIINEIYTLTAGQIRTLVIVNVLGGVTMSTTPVVLSDLN